MSIQIIPAKPPYDNKPPNWIALISLGIDRGTFYRIGTVGMGNPVKKQFDNVLLS